jgi:hypothetical protein
MSCLQDPDLLKHGISVDKFSVDVPCYMLTHAHSDHMKGLKSSFSEKRYNSKIYCTRVTMDLARIAIEGLAESDFVIVSYGQPCILNSHVTAWAFPSYHCDGSCMFLFEVDNKSDSKDDSEGALRIFYTGDFRFHPEMRKHSLITDFLIDRLYYDDMFDEITTTYPTYQESLTHILSCIAVLQDKGHKRINIHCSILGLEPILREISDTTGIKFGLLPSLRNTWRGQQLKYLLEKRLDENRVLSVSLGSHKHENLEEKDVPWIIPTCTYFICDEEHKKKIPRHHFYVWFCTHSNQKENTQMKVMIAAKNVNACGNALQELKCQKS